MAASNGSEFFEIELSNSELESSFGRSSNAEAVAKDEEDLIWAAFERLPSVKRTNLAVIYDDDNGGGGNKLISTIDVTKLDRNRREMVVLKALDTAEQDNYKLVSGVKKRFKRMTLLLGPPGAGKSTLLLALAGKLDSSLKHFMHTVPLLCHASKQSYIGQTDNHIAELTVRETFDFAARCQGASESFSGYMEELVRLEKQTNIRPSPEIDAFMKALSVGGKKHSISTDYLLKVLGLDVCADTVVGNDMNRGVSGGQRKRVTSGEMIVGPKKTLFMDEISTVLDSSTTFQIVKCIGNFVHQMEGTVLMALLQPAPETFELFDDLILLSEGNMVVYHGPRTDVLEFFESIGFRLPPRKGVADFLQEVTSKKDQEQYWADPSKPYQFIRPEQIAEAFKNSRFGKTVEDTLSAPYEKSQSHPLALSRTMFAVPKWELYKACFSREVLLIRRHSFLYIFRTCQTPSLLQQRDNCFYPAWAWSLSSWVLRVPYSILESVVWSCVVYFMVGFTPEAGRFFRFMLLLFVIHQMALGLFRMLATLARDMVIASTCSSASMLAVLCLGGFILPKNMIKPGWIWAYWISPLSYAQNAVSVNEFTAPRWMQPSGNTTVGKNVLELHGMPTDGRWYWIGIFALLCYALLFNCIVTLALAYLSPLKKAQTVIPVDNSIDGAPDEGKDEVLKSNGASPKPVKNKGMILPFEPLSMTFHNVNYFVDMPKAMKEKGVPETKLQLLANVSGVFSPGVLTALVGSSGAGKTTLMDVLAGRKTGGYIKGDIRISGYPKVQHTFARISGYVEQNDIHSPQVTVEESLWFSSSLLLPKEINKETKKVSSITEFLPHRVNH
uniref:ABC transporter domain-containing protein n=1 Tax=Chenopodium quinoa TaxID=63459 RepID=A0A803KRJ4_CHEQI